MAFKSNRDYLEALEKTGDVVRIKDEVDWDVEAGAIIRRTCERQAQAVLFDNVRDYPGQSIFGAPLATYRRIGTALGLDVATHPGKIHGVFEERFDKPIKPIEVKGGPCKENIITGDKVNLFDLASPMVHEGDGARYIGTWHAVITKDPDTGWHNWGMYRVAVHNKRHVGCQMIMTSDMGRVLHEKYIAKGKRMPVCVAVGMDPLSSLASMLPVGYGVDEAAIAGGLGLQPIELTKAETCDMLVPAHAEIVIEGDMSGDILLHEGPFGEATGYRDSPRRPMPVIQINCITHRNNPIMSASNMGIPVDDCAFGGSLGYTYAVKKWLKQGRIPIKDVYLPPQGVAYVAVVSIPKGQKYSYIANQISDVISSITILPGVPDITIVVDDDVDVFNIDEVFHALATKCHPINGITSVKSPTIPLTPHLSLDDRLWSKGGRVVFDASWPADWPPEAVPTRGSFRDIYPEEIQDRVKKNWEKWGLS